MPPASGRPDYVRGAPSRLNVTSVKKNFGVALAKEAVSIEVEGLKELRAALSSVDKGLTKELRLVNKSAADTVRDTAKTMAPKVSGRLIRSITSKSGQREASIKAGSPGRVPYAGPIIFGHRPRAQGGYTEPNNFLIRALGYDYDYIKKLYEKNINKLAEKHL